MLDIYVQRRLKMLLDNLGISQREFAIMIDSTDSAVSNILMEKEYRPRSH